ncbi:MAG: hypothetical protein AABY93_02975 [Bacteroidota bacterium]
MDDFKIIFWIIVGLIYIISKARARQKKQVEPTEDRTETAPESKPISFEELLREIQQAKNPKPQPDVLQKPVLQTTTQRPAKPYDYQDYDDDIEEEEKGQEIKRPDYKADDKIYDVYEEAKRQAFVKPSLEESMKLEDTVVRFDQFKGYKQEKVNTLGMTYLKDLNDPVGFKKAFILSEILKRKF